MLTENDIQELKTYLQKILTDSLKAQGHFMTGKVAKEIKLVASSTVDTFVIELYVLKYGEYLERGVSKGKIPYYPGSGRKTSRYIDALVDFVGQRMGLSGKEALGVAFAIARKQKEEGMPTKKSLTQSSTGKRTGWIKAAMSENEKGIRDLLFSRIRGSVEIKFRNMVKQYAI